MNAWLVRQGEGCRYASTAKEKGEMGVGWLEACDLSSYIDFEQREFFDAVRPHILDLHPDIKPNAVGGVLGQLYRFTALIESGDIIFMPEEHGMMAVGVVGSPYIFTEPDTNFPYSHRRKVQWFGSVPKTKFSEGLRNSSGSIMTVFSLTNHLEEVSRLRNELVHDVPDEIQEHMMFGLEEHLEEFLVKNWNNTILAKEYEIYIDEDGTSGQQFVTDVGRIDILAKRKDGRGWLVIELKRGKENDKVIGQIVRYIGWTRRNLAQNGEGVTGMVVVHERDEQLTYALQEMKGKIDAYCYEVKFNLRPY
ncbi:MAG: endonuclease NucS domain-containing protein [Patescibacteria group bacterium]